MDKKLQNIYQFLQANRKHNKAIQVGEYKACLLPYDTTFNKVYALLYNILNSQSQLKMNKSKTFFETITSNKNNLTTASNFIKCLNKGKALPATFSNLFEVLKSQPSWGDKTAALFTKAIYQTHIGYAKQLHFWNDTPTELSNTDTMHLPVDAVILFIFNQLGNPCPQTFKDINYYIKTNAPNTKMEIWDDLWFWGFITQKTENKTRKMQYNDAKYWNLLHSAKDATTIAEIKLLAEQFIKLIKAA